jgi:hypothetical protein
MLASFAIEDDLTTQDTGAVEVTLLLDNGKRRWCFFMTPTALATCGDFIPGTDVRYHRAASHMIVVAGRIDKPTIERVLRAIDKEGELINCSRPIED